MRVWMGASEHPGREHRHPAGRRVVYCVIPAELAPKLHYQLRRHFRDRPDVEVVVERRASERRAGERRDLLPPALAEERRLIRNLAGRRIGERRAALVAVEPLELPRGARRYATRIAFVERLEPSSEEAEDLDTGRLVTRIQASERELFTDLYIRYFDRVHAYLRIVLNDAHEAEDATQQVFLQVFEAIARYERRAQPFRAWLFAIVRNLAVRRLGEAARVEARENGEIERRRERTESEPGGELSALAWISDPDLMLFIERLPASQRQVLALRYMLDLDFRQIGTIMNRRDDDVRALHFRALRFLRERLEALGRPAAQGRGRVRMHRCPDKANVLRARRWALHL